MARGGSSTHRNTATHHTQQEDGALAAMQLEMEQLRQ